MVEVIHEHETPVDNGRNNMNSLIGIILVVVVILFLFYYFGRGLLTGSGAGQSGVNIPDHVDVNVNQQPAK
jgi:hypothetical protein